MGKKNAHGRLGCWRWGCREIRPMLRPGGGRGLRLVREILPAGVHCLQPMAMNRKLITAVSSLYSIAGVPVVDHHMLPFCLMSLPLLFHPKHSSPVKGFRLPFSSELQTGSVFLSSTSCQIKQILPLPRLKMTCLLLKAFKRSTVLADYQIHCLVARETHTRGLGSPFFFFFLPPSSPEAHISKLSAASCAHTAAFQLKAFCAASGGAAWRGKESGWEWLRGEGGKMKGLPHCCQGNLMSR